MFARLPYFKAGQQETLTATCATLARIGFATKSMIFRLRNGVSGRCGIDGTRLYPALVWSVVVALRTPAPKHFRSQLERKLTCLKSSMS